jgi:uncharacterized membrane-anchored protein YhcB (DUF1043 family)
MIGTIEMTELGLAFMIGFIVGLVMRPKDKDLEEQQEIYDNKVFEYQKEIEYYKDLCKWHVEQRKNNGQT